MQTLTIKNRVRVLFHEEIETKIELPAYYEDELTGEVYAIAEDKKMVLITNNENLFQLKVIGEDDMSYQFNLKYVTNSCTPTTEDHFFAARDKFFKRLL